MNAEVRIKIYSICITREGTPSSKWYYMDGGKIFQAVLVVKDVTYGRGPVFALVEKDGDDYRPPGVVRTVRPEHCVVVSEELVLRAPLLNYVTSF